MEKIVSNAAYYLHADLPEYREFHISLKTTDRVYLALKKIENLEKIPAEQLILCALLAPVAASTAPKAETPGDQNDSKVVEATAKDVAAGAQTEANDNEEKTAQDNTAELEKEAVGTDSANSNPQVAEEAPALVRTTIICAKSMLSAPEPLGTFEFFRFPVRVQNVERCSLRWVL